MDTRFIPCGRDSDLNNTISGKRYGELAEYAKFRYTQSPNRAVRRQAAKLAKRLRNK